MNKPAAAINGFGGIIMQEIDKLREINKLKQVYRKNSVGNRKESSAEHSWSCLIIADYFISRFGLSLDRLKAYELLIYHDLIEAITGDIPLYPGEKRLNKKANEKKAIEQLQEKLPYPISTKFQKLFKEFEEQKTPESRFAKAVDAIDAVIHELDYKEDWQEWTEEFFVDSKLKFFEGLPELKKAFIAIIGYLKSMGYFKKQENKSNKSI